MITLIPLKISQTTQFYDALEDLPTKHTYSSTERHTNISAEVLADRFRIGIKWSNATLTENLHRGTISSILLISSRYRVDRQNGVKRLKVTYPTNTLWGKIKSLKRNSVTQVYIHQCGFTTVYRIHKTNNNNIGNGICAFISEYGVPEHLTYAGASVQVGIKTIFQNHVRKHEIQTHR